MLFANPRNAFGMEQAVISMLAGDVFGTPEIGRRLAAYKLLYYFSSLRSLRATLRTGATAAGAWRRSSRAGRHGKIPPEMRRRGQRNVGPAYRGGARHAGTSAGRRAAALTYGASTGAAGGPRILQTGLSTVDGVPTMELWRAPGATTTGVDGPIRYCATPSSCSESSISTRSGSAALRSCRVGISMDPRVPGPASAATPAAHLEFPGFDQRGRRRSRTLPAVLRREIPRTQ